MKCVMPLEICPLWFGAQVHREPVVQEASDDGRTVLKADLAVRGVWQPQCDAVFDV